MVRSKSNAAVTVPHGLIEVILGTASDVTTATDADGRITFWNPGATRIFGFTSDRLYLRGGCRELPRFDHSGTSQSTPLGGIHSGNGNRRKPLRPRRRLVGAAIDQGVSSGNLAATSPRLSTRRLPQRKRECEMTELTRLESQYDAFLFASVCETDEMTLSVLSVLARHDVDPWQEAARLAQLSKDQAVNSLASRIWKSNSERWSASEATTLAARLIELLPSRGRPSSNQLWVDDGNARLTFWVVAGLLSMSIAISGNGMQKAKDSDASTHIVSTNVQENAATRSSRGIGTD
jgi:hypothetical protein